MTPAEREGEGVGHRIHVAVDVDGGGSVVTDSDQRDADEDRVCEGLVCRVGYGLNCERVARIGRERVTALDSLADCADITDVAEGLPVQCSRCPSHLRTVTVDEGGAGVVLTDVHRDETVWRQFDLIDGIVIAITRAVGDPGLILCSGDAMAHHRVGVSSQVKLCGAWPGYLRLQHRRV